MALNSKKIFLKLKTNAAVHLYDSIDSTNNEAKRNAETDSGVCLYAASHQTAGRGRRGHDFYSPKNTGLYMTLSLPCSAPADVQLLTCAAAVAVCDSVEALTPQKPQIKWVNDIFIGGRKVAGILTELVSDSTNRPLKVIVGIGINLKTEDFPDEIASTAGNLGDIDPEALCATVTDKLVGLYGRLGDPAVIDRYRRYSLVLGKTVRYTKDNVRHAAIAVDIADDGGLIVEENGSRSVLSSGEISVSL